MSFSLATHRDTIHNFSTILNLYIVLLYMKGITVRVLSSLILLSIISLRFICVAGYFGGAFLHLSNSTIHLSIHRLVDIWDVSSFGLLRIKFLWAVLNKSFSGHKFSFLLDTYQGGIAGQQGRCIFNFIKICQIFSQSGYNIYHFHQAMYEALVFLHSNQYLASLY